MPNLDLQCGGFSSKLAGHAGRTVLGWGASNPGRRQAHIISDNYEAALRRYMEALGASDYATIKSLFADDGTVTSPFLRLMPARDFFDKLGGAKKGNVIAPIDGFLPSGHEQHAVAFFWYDWMVNDGTLITFHVMDLLEFRPGTDKVGALTLIYATHPIRQTGGNKYKS